MTAAGFALTFKVYTLRADLKMSEDSRRELGDGLSSLHSALKDVKPVMSAELDFERMKAFSVERNADGRTVVGYIAEGKVKEWFLQTNDEIHSDIIAKFKLHLAKQ
jgi:hypothetical protein